MADHVEKVMQEMVPELDDLRRKRIFNDDEIRHIVRRRRDFEYSLQKTPSKPQDYLGYVRYEVALECLRSRRSKSLHWRRKSLSDFAGLRRLHSIFSRGLKKFKADKRFWYQYVDFCLRSGSTRILSRTLLRALKFHPREVSFWLLAADRELKCGHIKAARALLLRGLRATPRSPKLWGELLRLEVRLACHLRAAKSTDESVTEEAGGRPWAPACLVLRRAVKRLEGSAQPLASLLSTASSCQDEALHKLPGKEGPGELTAELRTALASSRPLAGSEAPEEAAVSLWELWWREERRSSTTWTAITEAAVPAAPPSVLGALALQLSKERAASTSAAEDCVAALVLVAASPSCSSDPTAARVVLEALEKRASNASSRHAAQVKEASRSLQVAAAEKTACPRLRLLALSGLPVEKVTAAVSKILTAGTADLDPFTAMMLYALATGKADSGALDEAQFEQLLRSLRAGVYAAQLIRARLMEALAQGRDLFQAACSQLQALATRLWEAPSLRMEVLAAVLDAELRVYTPVEAPAKRMRKSFEELLDALQDNDPDKVEWWLRYVEFSQRLGRCGRNREVPDPTELHWRAMRSVSEQSLYTERAHHLLGSAASG
jgi:hypothetical protein